MPVLEEIGAVSTRSGGLIVIDTGYLGIWSHDHVPFLPEGELDTTEATNRANSFVDLHITGSDAERAGQLLDMSWNPFFVYDQPPDYFELNDKLEKLTHKHNLDARFQVVSPRIPHRERLNLALKQGAGADEIQFHGIWAAVIGGVPIGQPLRVVGERMPEPEKHKWKSIFVDCNPRLSISRSEKVGHVAVDYARLLIADFDALGAWQHEESLAGLADYVFWGLGAKTIARAVDSPQIRSDEFGWIDVSETVAQERRASVEEYGLKHNLKFAADYRPHSHHWEIMRRTRNSPTESGTIDVAGAKVCNFMTTWGDGIFEVHRDLDELDELVQIRIEFNVT